MKHLFVSGVFPPHLKRGQLLFCTFRAFCAFCKMQLPIQWLFHLCDWPVMAFHFNFTVRSSFFLACRMKTHSSSHVIWIQLGVQSRTLRWEAFRVLIARPPSSAHGTNRYVNYLYITASGEISPFVQYAMSIRAGCASLTYCKMSHQIFSSTSKLCIIFLLVGLSQAYYRYRKKSPPKNLPIWLHLIAISTAV